VPTIDLYPSTLATNGSGVTLAGAADQWADGSDATYARFSGTGQARGLLPLLTVDPAKVAAITWNFRAGGTSTAPGGPRVDFQIQNPGGSTWGVAGMSPDDVPASGQGWHVTGTATDYAATPDAAAYADMGFTLLEVAGWLASGTALLARRLLTSGYSSTVTVYEFWLTVTYGGTHAPPLRQFPRSDGLATSSARRMWPPSRSYQRGIRRAGGYL
jgi:hypothetical protein